MDRMIAEKVLGRDPMNARVGLHDDPAEIEYHWGYPAGHDIAGYYSTSVGFAEYVVEHIHTLLFSRRYAFLKALQDPALRITPGGNTLEFVSWWMFNADKPLEICRAALIAMGEAPP